MICTFFDLLYCGDMTVVGRTVVRILSVHPRLEHGALDTRLVGVTLARARLVIAQINVIYLKISNHLLSIMYVCMNVFAVYNQIGKNLFDEFDLHLLVWNFEHDGHLIVFVYLIYYFDKQIIVDISIFLVEFYRS